jgi:hypothetical protein
MATISVSDFPLETDSPAQRLRRIATAVRVHFTWWGVHRTLTAQQKEEVGLAYNADARFLTAGKKLVDVRHEAFRALTSIRTRVVNFWRGLSLPYLENGIRLIRQSDIEAFVHTMTGFRDDLTEAEAGLSAVYTEIKADARRRLGRLHNPSDYPPEVRGLFAVEWDFPSVEPPSYLMQLNPDIYQREQERVSHRFEQAVQLAEQAFVSEFARLVAHLTERLHGGPQGERQVFRDSTITNLTEFFERFKHLNVNSSQELDRLIEQAQLLVRGVTPQGLRHNEDLRRHVATELARVRTGLDHLLVDRPRRRIIRSSPSANAVSHATTD